MSKQKASGGTLHMVTCNDVRVVGVKRGEVTLDSGPDGRLFRLPTDDAEVERALAQRLNDERGGTLLVAYFDSAPTMSEGEASAAVATVLQGVNDELRAENARLKALVAGLEKAKGVLSVRLERPEGRHESWVVTAPSTGVDGERRLGMLVAAALAHNDAVAFTQGAIGVARAHGLSVDEVRAVIEGRDDAPDSKDGGA